MEGAAHVMDSFARQHPPWHGGGGGGGGVGHEEHEPPQSILSSSPLLIPSTQVVGSQDAGTDPLETVVTVPLLESEPSKKRGRLPADPFMLSSSICEACTG